MIPSARNIAVTGLGLVTPLGVGVQTAWKALLAGQSGIVDLKTNQHTKDLPFLDQVPCTVAGVVPRDQLDPSTFMNPGDDRKTSLFIQHALKAAKEALDDAQWHPTSERDRQATGVMIGSGIGGVDDFSATALHLAARQARKISPFAVPKALVNLAAGWVSLTHGFQGPSHCVATACAAGANAIGDAARMIQYGDANVMVAGAAESTINAISLAGFARAKALCTAFNHDPPAASRPFDQKRAGFVMGEGAGVVVLEDLEHARARGAKVYAVLAGYGTSCDAHHITAPPDDGRGAARAMEQALRGITDRSVVAHINTHATSTEQGDVAELRAIRTVFGDVRAKEIQIAATKSATGHLLGAAGAVEAIWAVLALHHGIVPPTLNLHDPDPEADGFQLTPLTAVPKPDMAAVMSNSFGFGGTNASLVFAHPDTNGV
ncbi:beta-ketoacyl-acyl-carrier-protein synthase II [Allomyces macrogynus ATCC 38327]|uniref:3-oxoacyl-[acyl-carrier-protein] synthase n=1 Tax=Allomyces macrogynus (strain ATCC 38327) TaxID=578462 RepID=A0A0L0TAL7_ALLM3|nr:beta-ketoacyl-acyl-carrier-protein synthase II [Allomyces macrogynus ATCC 38327]|eukprot:KNE71802.1 beta-ketoacyl-acyl-carrier-protein synthase II [Allomyces macrogynus ATCC 38327]